MGQDNLCYRDDGCEQANEGEQIKGKDNKLQALMTRAKTLNSNSNTAVTTPANTNNKHFNCNQTRCLQLYLHCCRCPTADCSTSRQPQATAPPYSFSGSESGTPLTINPPFPVTYQVTETDAQHKGLSWPPYPWDSVHLALPLTQTTGLCT